MTVPERDTRTFLFEAQREQVLAPVEIKMHDAKDLPMGLFFKKAAAAGDEYIGLSGSYDEFGAIHFLAMAYSKNINIHVLTPDKNSPRKPEKDKEAITKLLTKYLAEKDYKFLAFDGDTLAISLFHELGIRVKNLVHLPMLRPALYSGKDPWPATFELLKEAGYKNSHLMELKDTFDFTYFNPDYKRRLAFRASSARYMAAVHKEDIEKTETFDTLRISANELSWYASQALVQHQRDAFKPSLVQNDFSEASIDSTGAVSIKLDRFKTRIREDPDADQTVHIEYAAKGKATPRTLLAKTKEVSGKSASLFLQGGAQDLVKGGEILSITTVGRQSATKTEKAFHEIVLDKLTGRSSVNSDRSVLLQMMWAEDEHTLAGIAPSYAKRPGRVPKGTTLPPSITVFPLNYAQCKAILAFLNAPAPSIQSPYIQVIHGPPGTGKTSVIGAMVQGIVGENPKATCYVVAEGNVAIKNVAEKLHKIGFNDYKLIVSKEFFFEWHLDLYDSIMPNVIESTNLPKGSKAYVKTQLLFSGIRVILCTLSMLVGILGSSPEEKKPIKKLIPPTTIIIDEASQIELSGYTVAFQTHKATIRQVCFVGDDRQLAPFGEQEVKGTRSIFDTPLRPHAYFLDTQYRMPVPIGNFISEQVYDAKLKSRHWITAPECVRFIDVDDGREERDDTSWVNNLEVEAVVACATQLEVLQKTYRVITGYEAQRNALQKAIKEKGLVSDDIVFTVDSFQGNESDYIIISLVRTEKVGFLEDNRRTNVMLSRCRKGLIIVANRHFLFNHPGARDTLVGKFVASRAEDKWLTVETVESGQELFNEKLLKGELDDAAYLDESSSSETDSDELVIETTEAFASVSVSDESPVLTGASTSDSASELDNTAATQIEVEITDTPPASTIAAAVTESTSASDSATITHQAFAATSVQSSAAETFAVITPSESPLFEVTNSEVLTPETFENERTPGAPWDEPVQQETSEWNKPTQASASWSDDPDLPPVMPSPAPSLQSSLRAAAPEWVPASFMHPPVEETFTRAFTLEAFSSSTEDENPIIQQLLGYSVPNASALSAPQDGPVPQCVTVPLGPAQERVVRDTCTYPATVQDPSVCLVYGAPGTGKTQLAVATAQWLCGPELDDEANCIYITSPSGSSLAETASRLNAAGFSSFRVITSEDQLSSYNLLHPVLQQKVVPVHALSGTLLKIRSLFGDARVILCDSTLISDPRLLGSKLVGLIPPTAVLIDDAGQTPAKIVFRIARAYSKSLTRVICLGHDQQMVTMGDDGIPLDSIFDIEPLRMHQVHLDTNYRSPKLLNDFIASAFFDNAVHASREADALQCVRLVEVSEGVEIHSEDGIRNVAEAKVVALCAQQLHNQGSSLRIVCDYPAQRNEIRRFLDHYSVPSENMIRSTVEMQGQEADYVVFSAVRTRQVGPIANSCIVSTMLSRCTRGVVIVVNGTYLMQDEIAKTTMLAALGFTFTHSWMPWQDVAAGNDIFDTETMETLPLDPPLAPSITWTVNDAQPTVVSNIPMPFVVSTPISSAKADRTVAAPHVPLAIQDPSTSRRNSSRASTPPTTAHSARSKPRARANRSRTLLPENPLHQRYSAVAESSANPIKLKTFQDTIEGNEGKGKRVRGGRRGASAVKSNWRSASGSDQTNLNEWPQPSSSASAQPSNEWAQSSANHWTQPSSSEQIKTTTEKETLNDPDDKWSWPDQGLSW